MRRPSRLAFPQAPPRGAVGRSGACDLAGRHPPWHLLRNWQNLGAPDPLSTGDTLAGAADGGEWEEKDAGDHPARVIHDAIVTLATYRWLMPLLSQA